MEPVHIAGCAIIENGKILLLKKTKSQSFELPGGKVDQGESFEDAAIRETKEETGCDVDIVKYYGHIDFFHEPKNVNVRSHIFFAKIKKGEPKIMEPETFDEVIWMPIKDYKNYSFAPNVKKFYEIYLLNIS